MHAVIIVEVVPFVIYITPALEAITVVVCVIPFRITQCPSGLHRTIGVQDEHTGIGLKSAGGHITLLLEVVPVIVKEDPSGLHGTIIVHVVPFVIGLDPSGLHFTVLIKEIPNIVLQLPTL